MTTPAISSWGDVIIVLCGQPTGSIVRVPKGPLPHPKVFGMEVSLGFPVGQMADYRKRLEGGAGFHIRDFGTHYEAHMDAVHPSVDFLEHLRKDAPGTFVSGGAALGALLGTAIGRSQNAALLGAAVGAVVGALALDHPAAEAPTNAARPGSRKAHRAT
jgi:hypothetical protein